MGPCSGAAGMAALSEALVQCPSAASAFGAAAAVLEAGVTGKQLATLIAAAARDAGQGAQWQAAAGDGVRGDGNGLLTCMEEALEEVGRGVSGGKLSVSDVRGQGPFAQRRAAWGPHGCEARAPQQGAQRVGPRRREALRRHSRVFRGAGREGLRHGGRSFRPAAEAR
ncbi:unnamed protein product [Prorocentrum cordatum]|uniref:DhaL domain-containing protein n=1 Tax=Prorocentrum cordatum TaxID=2364126 RepID=A0ABN9RJJ4_9DINO|nr:unnamed protein product [Polarella glacialis]